MRDRRSVDELTIEELERILAIRKRAERQERLRRYAGQGRVVAGPPAAAATPDPPPSPRVEPRQHEAAVHLPPVEPPVAYDLTDDVPRFEDDLEAEIRQRQPAAKPTGPAQKGRKGFDRVLLAIEVVAVIGVVLVLAIGVYLVLIENDKLDALEQKSAEIQQEAAAMLATPSPAPELRVSAYVLPGGHYSPDKTGGVPVFNYDEVPASVRPAIAAQVNSPQAALPTPSAASPSPSRIEIPAINVSAYVFPGDDWASLQKGVGHYAGSANPGERNNMVLTGHNDIYGEIFRDIGLLEPGDEVRVQARNGRWYTYVVERKQVVNPTDIWVLEPGHEPIVTLITCHPYRVDTQRMIIFARLVEETVS
ncbi:MAG: sortase [Chloroflexi bacterium]|nr:sortase [Chloroflexota bacterium]